MYPYGLWGLHEILSLCGGDSWWKYPSYLSVLKNCGRLFSNEKDESMATKFKKLAEQCAKDTEEKIKGNFGEDANVEDIEGKIEKIQKKYKEHFEKRVLASQKIQKALRAFLKREKESKEKQLSEFDERDKIFELISFIFDRSSDKFDLDYKFGSDFYFDDFIIGKIFINQNINIKDIADEYSKSNKSKHGSIDHIVSIDNDVMKKVLSFIGQKNPKKTIFKEMTISWKKSIKKLKN